MPKRNNPFGDHSCLQLKTHIGTKEVDKGVDQQNRMLSVYDRTKKLLFDGVRKEMGIVGNNNNNDVWKSQEEYTVLRPDNMKQMHLNKFCQLVKEEDSEMDVDDNNKEERNCIQMNDDLQNVDVSRQKHDVCQSFPYPNKQIDCRFTNSEPRITDFVSASSLTVSNKCSGPKPLTFKGNAFDQLRQAQTFASRSHFTSGACQSCSHPVHHRDIIKCQFCENYVCGKCARQCSSCFLHFCHLCSILNYSQAVERAFCFSCNGK